MGEEGSGLTGLVWVSVSVQGCFDEALKREKLRRKEENEMK